MKMLLLLNVVIPWESEEENTDLYTSKYWNRFKETADAFKVQPLCTAGIFSILLYYCYLIQFNLIS